MLKPSPVDCSPFRPVRPAFEKGVKMGVPSLEEDSKKTFNEVVDCEPDEQDVEVRFKHIVHSLRNEDLREMGVRYRGTVSEFFPLIPVL